MVSQMKAKVSWKQINGWTALLEYTVGSFLDCDSQGTLGVSFWA